MKKKLLIFSIVVMAAGGVFSAGFNYAKYLIFPHSSLGQDRKSSTSTLAGTSTDFDAIRSLAYSGLGSRRVFQKKTGVTCYNSDKAYEGFNIYSSSHSDQACLLDMNGKVRHTWEYSREKIKELDDFPPQSRLGWRRVHVFKNMDLLGIYDYEGLVKINKTSQLLWVYPGGRHHDFWVTPDGSAYVLNNKKEIRKDLNAQTPVNSDYIAVLDASGVESWGARPQFINAAVISKSIAKHNHSHPSALLRLRSCACRWPTWRRICVHSTGKCPRRSIGC